MCANPESDRQPPWGAITAQAQSRNPAAGAQPVSYASGPGNLIVTALTKGKSYTITVSSTAPDKSCSATLVPDGATSGVPHFKKTGGGSCIPAEGGRLMNSSLP